MILRNFKDDNEYQIVRDVLVRNGYKPLTHAMNRTENEEDGYNIFSIEVIDQKGKKARDFLE